ncbi:nitrile hydratase subunit beta [Roseomonas xinghualingensis]|uniref:nitrile hydratase subunit beta n=1 Tax=Roseomonas xinghualingensis TaxID=2986475 RepID=UPI0021F0E075|nr:nitrile hydratase subunit beta [Roseomonas sp. SXEYE001]MCV4209848.1 nitrile hydratase subunit beta [Roseomonas sp. SXEYE001]
MPSPSETRQIYETGTQLRPTIHQEQDWPYEVPHIRYEALIWPPHDVGGQPAAPQIFEEKEDEEWENNAYITCEVLGFRGLWNAEERRRIYANDIGTTLYYGFPYNARWIWGAAKMLVDKKYVSLIELQEKIGEIRKRLGVNAQRGGHATSNISAGAQTNVTTNTGTGKTGTGNRPDYGSKAPWEGTGEIRPARFKVGDRVRVKDLPAIFYTRTQMYARNMSGTIAALTYPDLIPADEAWERYDAPQEQYYIVRFQQKDLWAEYPFENDTLQSEYPEMWLEAED